MTLTDLVIAAVVLAGLYLLMRPRLFRRPGWRATVTPLASIIGSGFLILGPILHESFGWAAPLAMILLCALGMAFGAAIRLNIATLEAAGGWPGAIERRFEELSAWVLAFAYVVSVAYYLNLFGAFAARAVFDLLGSDAQHPQAARWITTAALLSVLAIGWLRGFGGLERTEQIAVSLKLAIIAGLLVGLSQFTASRFAAGDIHVLPADVTGWKAVTLLLGLLITVQGFETSRYLGAEYSAPMRIRSMRLAQIVATAIYVVYIGLIAYVFAPGQVPLTETGVIDLMRLVAPVLPPMLIVAALSAQLSAALADTSGAGGLFTEVSRGRVPARVAYAIVAGVGVAMTWGLDVFAIVAWASRAFALYYGLQSALAALAAYREGGRPVMAAALAALSAIGFAAALFGTAVE